MSGWIKAKAIMFLPLCFALAGCTPEQNYRGVPSPVWGHLTAEQKQLIVDRSFEDEVKANE